MDKQKTNDTTNFEMDGKIQKKIVIVGAGFSGLTLAYYLSKKNISCEIFESSDKAGGLIGSHATEYGIVEQAANSLINSALLEDLKKDLDLKLVPPKSQAKKRFLFFKKPTTWPLSFLETLALIVKLFKIIFTYKTSFRPKPEETLAAWGQRNFGHAVTDKIISPAFQGIYSQSAEHLSSRLVLQFLFSQEKKQKHKGIVSGLFGTEDIIKSLVLYLSKKQIPIHFNKTLTSEDLQTLIHEKNSVVLATSAKQASYLCQLIAPDLSAQLKNIKMVGVTSTTVFFKKSQKPYQGFGCLIPKSANKKTLGILFNNFIFPNRAKDEIASETWILNSDTTGLSKMAIKNLILQERKEIFLQNEEKHLLDFHIFSWPEALPLYNIDLEKTLLQNQWHLPDGLFLHGNYLGGLGLSKILQRSFNLAEQITKESS